MVRRLTAFVLTAAAVTSSPASAARKKPVDTTPPRIEHQPPVSCASGVPCVVEARITDDSGVFDPTLLFRAAGSQTFERTAMQAVAGDATLFRAALPAALLASGDVEYLVEAFDVQGNGPARAGTDALPLRVQGTAPSRTGTTAGTKPGSATPDTTNAAAATGGMSSSTTPSPDGGNGLPLGLVVGGAVLAVAVAGGIAVALYALRPAGPDVVTVTIAAPTPSASTLLAGAVR